jgi:putative DNA methylase
MCPKKSDQFTRLIEEYFPFKEIEPIALREKKGRPPIFQMQYYWTRKPLSVIRPVLLGSLLPASFDKQNYLDLCGISTDISKAIYRIQPSDNDLKILQKHSTQDVSTLKILDPFAGGGSIPFECLRYNLNIIVNEYNPMAWLILKATLEYPNELPEDFLEEFTESYRDIKKSLFDEYGYLYPKIKNETVGAYLYCWMVQCPRCDDLSPLIANWDLCTKKNKKISYSLKIHKGQVSFELLKKKSKLDATCKNAAGICIHCHRPIINREVIRQLNRGAEEKLISVISIKNQQGKDYYTPRKDDRDSLKEAKRIFEEKRPYFEEQQVLPNESMKMHTIRAAKYLKTWEKLFNPRQLLITCSLADLIKKKIEHYKQKRGKKYAEYIGVYLSFILGKLINRNSRLSTWDRPGEKIMHACSNKLNAIQWDHSEINPFAKVSGCFDYGFRDISRAIKYATDSIRTSPNQIINKDFMSLNQIDITRSPNKTPEQGSVDLIITDPPYYDDAPYSELSEFFYVWYSRILKDTFPDNPNFKSFQTPKEADLSVSHERKGKDFDRNFIRMCEKISQVLNPNGLLVLFFAHPKVSTWESVIRGFRKAKLHVTTTWPVTTESKGIANVKKKNALLSSLIIIARKIPVTQITKPTIISWDEFIEIYTARIDNKKKSLEKSDYRESDFIIIAVGLALEILTNPKYQIKMDYITQIIKYIQEKVNLN